MVHWVIAYDIRANRRRTKVARRLEQAGLRVQKSVFVIDAATEEVRKLVRELSALIDPHTDQVAAWRLAEHPHARRVLAGLPPGPLYQETIVW
jgi:CRISPR-associated endonuclease Cas2